jgi:hypothetical protein
MRSRISLQRERQNPAFSRTRLESAFKAIMEKVERNWALSAALILVAIVAASSI